MGKWVTSRVIHLPTKKATGALCAQPSLWLIKRFSPAAFLYRERWDQVDIQGVRAYYQGFDPYHSHFTYLNQKLWKTLRKFNPTPGSLTLHDYQRKVAEGKNKMSIINAVRNKLLHRVVAVIKRGTPYQIQLQKS